jgi:hypothetical protein
MESPSSAILGKNGVKPEPDIRVHGMDVGKLDIYSEFLTESNEVLPVEVVTNDLRFDRV